MLKKLMTVICFALMSYAGDSAQASSASRIVMLVVPARYSVLQVAFDVVRQFPVVLVSYQGDATTESPRLHAWNGREWIPISAQDYRDANFLQVRPSQAVLVGDEKLLPPIMSSISTWCPSVNVIPSIDTASMVNELGRIFKFRARDWQWYSARYNLVLKDVNEDRRHDSWYDHPFVENAAPAASREEIPEAAVGDQNIPALEPAPLEGPSSTPMPSVAVEFKGQKEAQGPATSDVVAPSSSSEIKPLNWEEKAVATDPIPAD